MYSELLVKKDRTAKDVAIKYGLITLTVLFAVAGLFIMPLLLVAALGPWDCLLFYSPQDRRGV